MYKVVFIDLDGTLLNNDEVVSDYNKKILNILHNKGIKIILTTGRYSENAINVAKSIGIKPYIICSNGTEVYNFEKDEIIYTSNINKNTVKSILNYCNENSMKLYFNTKYKRFSNINYKDEYKIVTVDDIDNIDTHQLVIISNNYNKMLAIKELYKELYPELYTVNSSTALITNRPIHKKYYYHDFINVGNSKGKGINELLEYLNISKEESIGIGDSLNDLSMFEAVGLSVVMDNTIDEVKERANIITKSNEEDGVGIILNKIFELGENHETN